MKPLSIRIPTELVDQLTTLYGAKVTGAQVAVQAYLELQRRTMQELKGRFDIAEIHAIVDNMNGTLISPETGCHPQMLLWHLEDGDTYEGLFTKWDIDAPKFRSKILALTAAQTWFLQDAVRRFWEQGGGDLEAFAKTLL